MRISAILVMVALSSAAKAGEPSIDLLIEDLKKNYDRMVVDFKGIADQTTAESARKRLDKVVDERDTLMRSVAGLNLKPVDRERAQTKLNAALATASQALQTEIARLSLIPAAFAKIEDIVVVKEMAGLIEARARVSVDALDRALKIVAIRNDGKFPKNLNEVERYLADKTVLRDPWGREWQYDLAGMRNDGKNPDVWAISPFNGGKKVIGNWEAKK